MNSVRPTAGYSAAGKPRTQEEQEMDLKFQSKKYRKCRRPRQAQKKSRMMLLMNEIQGHFRCIKRYYINMYIIKYLHICIFTTKYKERIPK